MRRLLAGITTTRLRWKQLRHLVALYAKFSLPGNSKIWIRIQIFQLSGEERLFCEALRKTQG
jgi:hypothetical protein